MIIKQQQLEPLLILLNKISTKVFSIETQYKFLKIKKTLKSEYEIRQEQFQSLTKYCEVDENNNFIQLPDGSLKIKEEFLQQAQETIQQLNELEIQLPDIYFSLQELEPLGLTMGELELLESFIK